MSTPTITPRQQRANEALQRIQKIVAHHTRRDTYKFHPGPAGTFDTIKGSPFSEFEGDLWKDGKVLRKRYAWHHRKIETTAHLLVCLRAGQFAWPGGYECFFYTADGSVLSFEACAEELRQVCDAIRTKDTRSGWCVVACDCAANVDGPVTCEHTGRTIVEGPEETE